MKKNQVVLIIILVNFIVFISYLVLWLSYDQFSEDNFILILLLSISYIMPITLIGLYVLLKKEFSSKTKLYWILYILATSFIGTIHFYFLYKDDIQNIALESKRKMINGPKSLDEFKEK